MIADQPLAVEIKMFATVFLETRLFNRRLVWRHFGNSLLLYVYGPNCTFLTSVGLFVQRDKFLAAFHCYFPFFSDAVLVSFSLVNGETFPGCKAIDNTTVNYHCRVSLYSAVNQYTWFYTFISSSVENQSVVLHVYVFFPLFDTCPRFTSRSLIRVLPIVSYCFYLISHVKLS